MGRPIHDTGVEMPITEAEELFVHELGDVLYAERKLLKVLPKLAKEAEDEALRNGIQHHEQETRGQVERLEQVFELLGAKPQAEKCAGIDGIIEEHDTFVREEEPSASIRDLFLVGATLRTEHYEIAAYTGLIGQAEAMGERDAAKLLRENLREEEKMAKEAERLGKELAPMAV
jgi:ferritin-like metal-binding protein YciE